MPFAILKYCSTSGHLLNVGVSQPDKELHVSLESYRWVHLKWSFWLTLMHWANALIKQEWQKRMKLYRRNLGKNATREGSRGWECRSEDVQHGVAGWTPDALLRSGPSVAVLKHRLGGLLVEHCSSQGGRQPWFVPEIIAKPHWTATSWGRIQTRIVLYLWCTCLRVWSASLSKAADRWNRVGTKDFTASSVTDNSCCSGVDNSLAS